jgi:hypothetical protein
MDGIEKWARGGAKMVIAALLLLVGFASGYGVREVISQRRRAAVRKRQLEEEA